MINDEDPWEKRAACRQHPDLDWYSTDKAEQYSCRAVCQSQCPVRRKCLETALNDEQRWGIWGGVDDYELRRALSIDALGKPTTRVREPRCPFCLSRKLTISGIKSRRGYPTRCESCGLEWHVAAIHNKHKKKRATK